MIPYTKKQLFACWNNRCIIVSACGDYSISQIVYACVDNLTPTILLMPTNWSNRIHHTIILLTINKMIISRLRLFLMESLCQRSLFCSSARSVVCSGAALSVHKWTFHAPMVRFMRRSRVILLYCSPEGG